ncbi:DUF5753 domain-containing protein [Sphaerisporangium sp. NPDC088356]|uniref:DUF5753 domain-containing protein n=1 Tax=Sphaerisporangium sp. NPDC088356 TaxID=3154871 RepID=UPI00341ECB60
MTVTLESDPSISPRIQFGTELRKFRLSAGFSQRKLCDAIHILDESVLHRPIAGSEVMKGQFEHLLHIGENPRISLQVLPYSACSVVGLMGGFVVADMPKGAPPAAYIESQSTEDRVSERSDEVKGLALRYDVIRVDALPRSESLSMIKKTMRRWTT